MTPDDFRAARKTLGLTQAELAAVLSISRGAATISEWERGHRGMTEIPEVAATAMGWLIARKVPICSAT